MEKHRTVKVIEKVFGNLMTFSQFGFEQRGETLHAAGGDEHIRFEVCGPHPSEAMTGLQEYWTGTAYESTRCTKLSDGFHLPNKHAILELSRPDDVSKAFKFLSTGRFDTLNPASSLNFVEFEFCAGNMKALAKSIHIMPMVDLLNLFDSERGVDSAGNNQQTVTMRIEQRHFEFINAGLSIFLKGELESVKVQQSDSRNSFLFTGADGKSFSFSAEKLNVPKDQWADFKYCTQHIGRNAFDFCSHAFRVRKEDKHPFWGLVDGKVVRLYQKDTSLDFMLGLDPDVAKMIVRYQLNKVFASWVDGKVPVEDVTGKWSPANQWREGFANMPFLFTRSNEDLARWQLVAMGCFVPDDPHST